MLQNGSKTIVFLFDYSLDFFKDSTNFCTLKSLFMKNNLIILVRIETQMSFVDFQHFNRNINNGVTDRINGQNFYKLSRSFLRIKLCENGMILEIHGCFKIIFRKLTKQKIEEILKTLSVHFTESTGFTMFLLAYRYLLQRIQYSMIISLSLIF